MDKKPNEIHENFDLHEDLSNKIECFSYKGECGAHECTHIMAFKRRADLGYR